MTFSTVSVSVDHAKLCFYVQLVEDLARNLTSGKQTDLILLDFTKAFDKVNHLKHLYKLQIHGAQGKTLRWIESFLVGRGQTVVLNENSSYKLRVSSGVPLGSILVPSYFCYTLTTYLTVCSLKSISLQVTLQCT